MKRRPLVTAKITPTLVLRSTRPHIDDHPLCRATGAARPRKEAARHRADGPIHNIARITVGAGVGDGEIPVVVDAAAVEGAGDEANGAVELAPVGGDAGAGRRTAVEYEPADALTRHQLDLRGAAVAHWRREARCCVVDARRATLVLQLEEPV